MGVNNLLSFLRQTNMHACAKLRIEENRAYDLFIDLAIIIVPLMQRAKNVLHFEQLLQRTFDGSTSDTPRKHNRLVDVIVGARRVSMYLDMFSPKMKIETHNSRNVKMLSREAAATATAVVAASSAGNGDVKTVEASTRVKRTVLPASQVAAASVAAECRDVRAAEKIGDQVCSVSNSVSCGPTEDQAEDQAVEAGSSIIGGNGGLETTSSEQGVQTNGESDFDEALAQSAKAMTADDVHDNVRNEVDERPDMSGGGRLNVVKLRDIRSMLSDVILSSLAAVDRSIASRCTIDTDVVGEGEIKCFRSAINRCDPRDVAILSNDNDIFLMMLIHQEKLVSGANGAESNIFYRILINDTTDELTDINIQKITIDRNSVLRRIPASRRWCVLLWLICCSGTDFVSPLRPFSPSRRVEIFQNCLFEQSLQQQQQQQHQQFAVEQRRDGADDLTNMRAASSSSFSFNSFMRELRRFVAYVEHCYSKPVSRISAIKDGASSTAARCVSLRSKSRSLYSVSTWVVRLYWNLLYIIDLPVDFFRQPTFTSDTSMSINSYVPNVYTSFFLTSSVFKHMYDTELKSSVAAMLKFV